MSKARLNAAWAALAEHWEGLRKRRIEDFFTLDQQRFERYSISLGDVLLDYSKTKLDDDGLELLADLARAAGVEARRDAMFAGEKINSTEDRAVLHIALRDLSERPIMVDGTDVKPGIKQLLARMRDFAEGVREGRIRSSTDEAFTDVVNIGIGGSDLGPAMAVRALAEYRDGPRVHFVSNIDDAHIRQVLADLDPARTLFLIASKSFTTVETMVNAETAWNWLSEAVGTDKAGAHFAAISTALDKVKRFNIPESRVFGYWDWVGGRYSVWTSIGLPVMIAIGSEQFSEFLAGGHEIDEHFRSAPIERNMPMMLGLLGIWHANICGYGSRAMLPYDQNLLRLPAYIQQLDMESNGKSVALTGQPLARATGPVIWGEVGTNGQHAFFQLLHQGAETIPCEFLVAAKGGDDSLAHHHQLLVANCFAQSEALMRGRSLAEAFKVLLRRGVRREDAVRLAPHRTFSGDRPSTTLLYPRLDPKMLGRIIALYEHRVFVEGAIWGVNSFDQWGVELGKELATELYPMVRGEAEAGEDKDESTVGLLAWQAKLAGPH